MNPLATKMTMRANVSRGVPTIGQYTYNEPRLGDMKPLQDNVPCYVWIEQSNDFIDGKSVAVEKMKGYFRKDADVKRLDVITQIVNRVGDVVYEGPIVIDTITPKVIGALVSHLQLELRRHSGT